MHRIEIPEKKITVDFPSEIDEMTTPQYLVYIDLVLQYISGTIDENAFKQRLLQKLLDIRMSFRYGVMKQRQKLECDTAIVRLSELMDCFIEEYQKQGKPIKAFKLKSTRNFLPMIMGYYGPGDCFSNLTYCEYRTAREHFRAFSESAREEDLNLLVAVLYRPPVSLLAVRRMLRSWDGENRVPFSSKYNPLMLKRRAGRLAQVPYPWRYAVFLYFASCEDYLKTGKPVIDGVELDFSQLYSEKQEGETNKANVGMVGLLFSLAETGVFGTIEQTDNTNLWDIMVRVYQVVMQMREVEEKWKNKRSGTS